MLCCFVKSKFGSSICLNPWYGSVDADSIADSDASAESSGGKWELT